MNFIDRLLSRLEAKTGNQTDDYFWNAIRVYSTYPDEEVIRMAALAAAKKMSRNERDRLIKTLREFAVGEDAEDELNELADEIALKDWTVRDAVAAGLELNEFDPEYAEALDNFDSKVFHRRFPDRFAADAD